MKILISFILLLTCNLALYAFEEVPDPSATYCIENNGEYLLLENQLGVCNFDGEKLDSWSLFYYMNHSKKPLAIRYYLDNALIKKFIKIMDIDLGAKNFYQNYCFFLDGKVIHKENYKLCQFSDLSIMGLYTIYNGPNNQSKLTLLLKSLK